MFENVEVGAISEAFDRNLRQCEILLGSDQ